MIVDQKIYPKGSGGIKRVVIDFDRIIVRTRNDGDLIYRRDKGMAETPRKGFEGKRIVPADRGE